MGPPIPLFGSSMLESTLTACRIEEFNVFFFFDHEQHLPNCWQMTHRSVSFNGQIHPARAGLVTFSFMPLGCGQRVWPWEGGASAGSSGRGQGERAGHPRRGQQTSAKRANNALVPGPVVQALFPVSSKSQKNQCIRLGPNGGPDGAAGYVNCVHFSRMRIIHGHVAGKCPFQFSRLMSSLEQLCNVQAGLA